MKRCGFLLLESLIYITCSCLLLSLTGLLMAGLYTQARTYFAHAHSQYDFLQALDTLMQDMHRMPAPVIYWKKREPTSCVVTLNGQDYGWTVTKKRLMRYQGQFNTAEQRWHHRASSVVGAGITQVEFTYGPVANGCMSWVTCTLTNAQKHSLTGSSALRLGNVV